MTNVACFCGYCFSFEGGAAACPSCGEVASLTAGRALEADGRSQLKMPVPVLKAIGQNGQPLEACLGLAEASLLSGRLLTAHSRN